MMTTCGICGKRFVVTWPQHWVYRRKDVYLCGEDCMIVYDTQCTRAANGFGAKKKEGAEEDMAGKLTQKQREEVVDIAIKGGDPIAYLKDCGLNNPWASWDWIKKSLAKNDPVRHNDILKAETLKKAGVSMQTKLPANFRTVKPEQVAKVEKVDKVPEVKPEPARLAPMPMVLQGGVDYQLKVDEATVIRKPFKVTGLETDFGRFTIGTVKGVLRFQAPGETEISMVAEDWHKMAEVLPEILAALEV